MRKPEREITQRAEQEDILRGALVLRLAMCQDNRPYLVPMFFVYLDGAIYLHTNHLGLKMDFLAANPQVCFEASVDIELVPDEQPCVWDCHFRSLIGFGRVSVVEDEEERERALAALVRRYAGENAGPWSEKMFAQTCILRIDIDSMTGKRN